MPDLEQIAHDLAIAYINNRYGVEVSGDFSVSTYNHDVSGSGAVKTERLPDVGQVRSVRSKTGEKYMFGLLEKTQMVPSGYEVDPIFANMIAEYYDAFSKFYEMLEIRQGKRG